MHDPWPKHLDRGIGILEVLHRAGLNGPVTGSIDLLLALCHVLCWRHREPGGLPIVGILGSASCGKSTLFNSIIGRRISRVTPIPHQTAGAIVAAPPGATAACADPSFLRPAVEGVDSAPNGAAGLTGAPESATLVTLAVPAGGTGNTHPPVLLIDLPDLSTVESAAEADIALKVVPWLDRAILLVTEESFAQADHDRLARLREALYPERARPELFAVLNRVHAGTTDAQFDARLEEVHRFWPDAAVSTLPHLPGGGMFDTALTRPLTAECRPRVVRMVRQALVNLGGELSARLNELAAGRREERRRLEVALQRRVTAECRFRRSFLSKAFSRRLDAFSPWRRSTRRIRKVLAGAGGGDPGAPVPLLSPEAVRRHAVRSAGQLREVIERHRRRLASAVPAGSPGLPPVDEERIAAEVEQLAERVEQQAARDMQSIMESLQERRRVRDPVWSLLAAGAGSLFLLDLLIPSVGTLSTITVSGVLSALGLGGIMTSDLLRRLRTSRLRDTFEGGMRAVLEGSAREMLASPALAHLDLDRLSVDFSAWAAGHPEP